MNPTPSTPTCSRWTSALQQKIAGLCALLGRRAGQGPGEPTPSKFPVFSLEVPGRESAAGVHTRSFGSPADPQGWRTSQFCDEFEAHIAEAYFTQDSQALVRREQGKYVVPETQAAWDLWCKAIALTYARTRAPEGR